MGVVYEARDPRLKRTVAIKLLPPDLTKDDTAKQRFLQEAQAASALDHPNICTIFEINETDDGQLYLVMAHYEGETLKDQIGRGPLELSDAIDIATQVGEGLAEAHKAGIVHRDIKPANLFVTKSGVAKILDFGLAKLAGTEGMTQTGTTLGTVAYMSPEQARGQEVDHRTDIWSLGVVLYEMLAGEPPFQGENLLSLADAIRSQEPEHLTGEASSLLGAITLALTKDADRRYLAVTDLIRDLTTRPSTRATLTASSQESRDIPSIAVLPFTDMSPEKDQDYLCEGMAEEIINALTSLEGLRVASRTSAFKARDLDIAQIGTRLNVGSVLEGSVRKAGNRLRVTAQLVEVSNDAHLWSERYDRDMDDVFAVQDEIAHSVVEHLKVKLLGESGGPMVARPTENLEAYNLYLKGRFHLNKRTPQSFSQAIDYLERAIEKDPRLALAYVGLADIYGIYAFYGGLPATDGIGKVKVLAQQALEIDPTLGQAHHILAALGVINEYRWEEAEQEFTDAFRLSPTNVPGRCWYAAFLLANSGRLDQAVAHLEETLALEPLSPLVLTFSGICRMLGREYDEAVRLFQAALELDPNFPMAHGYLGETYCQQHEYERAEAELQKAVQTSLPGCHLSDGLLGYCYGRWGRTEDAERQLTRLTELSATTYVPALSVAMVQIGMGNVDAAFEWLNRAIDERYGALVWVGLEPLYDPLRSDPRFQDLLRRMEFPNLAPDPPRSRVEAAASELTIGAEAPTVAVTAPNKPDTPSIAVLPFLNMSADPEQEYFCDGLSEELIDALARLQGLLVVARTSAFQFRGKGHDLREIGEKLNVRTVLEGSVRKAGKRLRINAQLINTNDGYHLWSERFDRDMDDVFEVQDEITQSVVEKLKVKLLGGAATPLVKRPTDNVEAYNLILQGRYHLVRATEAALEKSLACFTQALALEPTYAQAQAGIALVQVFRGMVSLAAPRTVMPKAKEAALRALALDETAADAPLVLAYVLHYYEWDWAGAEREYGRALELNPGDAQTRTAYAGLLADTGRVDGAVAEARFAVERDPVSALPRFSLAQVFVAARRFEEAIAVAHAAIELDPSFPSSYQALGWGLVGLGRYDEAVEACRQQVIVAPGDPMAQAGHGWALGRAGRKQEALTILEDLERRRSESYVGGSLLAGVCVGLGDHDRAISWLQKAAEERDGLMTFVNSLFVSDPLRSDPRFQALLQRMNFPQQQ